MVIATIPLIYLIMIVAWVFLILAFYIQDYWLISLAAMLLIAMGIFTLINGLEGIDNLATMALGAVHVGVGGYTFIRGMIEIIYKNLK